MATTEATIPADSAEHRSWLDRIFGPLAGLHPGEANTALLHATNVFLLLGTYYLLKTVREALILTEGGAAVKSYSSAGQAVLMLAVVPLYGRIASAVSRVRLITNEWHPSYGAGIFYAPFNRHMLFEIAVGHSAESTFFLIQGKTLGLGF